MVVYLEDAERGADEGEGKRQDQGYRDRDDYCVVFGCLIAPSELCLVERKRTPLHLEVVRDGVEGGGGDEEEDDVRSEHAPHNPRLDHAEGEENTDCARDAHHCHQEHRIPRSEVPQGTPNLPEDGGRERAGTALQEVGQRDKEGQHARHNIGQADDAEYLGEDGLFAEEVVECEGVGRCAE